jgi:O-antigen/teichoic acid export membrane protein
MMLVLSTLAREGSVGSATAPSERAASRAAAASALMIVNLALKAALSFGVVALSVRMLGAHDAGAWLILQNVAMYLGLAELGLAQSVANFSGEAYARGDDRQMNRTISSAFALYWIIVLPLLVLTLALHSTVSVGPWLLRDAQPELFSRFTAALGATIALTFIRIPMTVFPAILTALRDIVRRQVFEIVNAVLNFAAIAIILLCGGTLLTLAIATNVTLAVAAWAVYPLVVKRRAPAIAMSWEAVSWPEMHRLFRNSSLFFLMGVAFLIDRSAGNFIASRYVSVSAVPAMFIMLTIFRGLGWSLVSVVSIVMQPYAVMYAAQQRKGDLLLMARLTTKVSVGIAVILVGVVLAFGSETLTWFTGGTEPVRTAALLYLGAALLVDALFQSTNNVLIALNEHRMLAVAAVAKAVLTVVFGITLATSSGFDAFDGMTLGFLLATLVSQVLIVPRATRRVLELGWRDYLVDFVTRPMLLLAPLGVATPFLVSTGSAWLRGTIAFSFAAAAVLVLWTLTFDKSERAWILAAWPSQLRWRTFRS